MSAYLSPRGGLNGGGFSLVGVLVAVGVLGIVTTILSKTIFNGMVGQDILQSKVEANEIATTLQTILGPSGTCQLSGLVGTNIDPASPASTPITIRVPHTGATGPIFMAEGLVTPGSKWKTTSLRFTDLTLTGPLTYFATLELVGDYRQGAASSAAVTSKTGQKKVIYVNLTLNAGHNILGCGGGSLGLTPASVCVFRSSSNVSPTACGSSVTCLAGEKLLSGGCNNTGCSVSDDYPSGNTWICGGWQDWTYGVHYFQFTSTAYATCCK